MSIEVTDAGRFRAILAAGFPLLIAAGCVMTIAADGVIPLTPFLLGVVVGACVVWSITIYLRMRGRLVEVDRPNDVPTEQSDSGGADA